MTSYLLLLVFAILMALIAIVFIVVGISKKNTQMWAGSLVGFVAFSLLIVFSIVKMVTSTVEYLGSDEFHEQTRKNAENWGKSVGNTITGASQGLEASIDEEAIYNLANKTARIAGNGVKAIAEGLDESVGKTTIFMNEEVSDEGIEIGRADEDNEGEGTVITLHLDFEKDFEGKLRLSAYDSEGTKMETSELAVKEVAGTEKVFEFPFSYSRPGLSGYCILSKAPLSQ